jgi:hypothetical protein
MLAPRITDPTVQAAALARWPAGRIVVRAGRLVEIRCGLLARRASIARVWWDSRHRVRGADQCMLDYHSPIFGRYLVLDYIAAGHETSLASIRGACVILDEIARIRQAVAIFAHVSTTAISDRLLRRCGWQPHLPGAPGRHWIKRFYDGYPDTDVRRYVPVGSQPPSKPRFRARTQP